MQTQPIILGTAGHIDHGKTALVRALTGIDCDRLKVEKERGITTELGFAHLDLDDRRFGFVDVPGHERFIRAMAAGATGIDLVCLVIAADEGIMPQTREHLDICELLGVRRGVVVLSKRDLVDDEWLELVSSEVREQLASSFLCDASIIPVSVKTGEGLDDLRAEILRLTESLEARSGAGSFRLPVDRVFSIRGFGTVVTGTVASGSVSVGDDLEIMPAGLQVKVRGIEVHGESSEQTRAGMRCAINVTGAATDQVRRGDVLADPDTVSPSHLIDARFRYLSTSKQPLGRRSRVLIHHGTTQRMASLVLIDSDELAPGDEALAQLRLDSSEPLVALPGDRFIARGFVVQDHYGTTIGGGEILRVHAPKVRRSAIAARQAVEAIAIADEDQRIALEVRAAASAGRSTEELMRRLGKGEQELSEALERLVADSTLVRTGSGSAGAYLHAEEMAAVEKAARDIVDRFHEKNPDSRGMPRAELRERLPPALPARFFEELLSSLLRGGALELDQDVVRRPGRVPGSTGAAPSPLDKKVADSFREWGNSPERPKEVASALEEPSDQVRRSLERLVTSGTLIKVRPDFLIHREPLEALRGRLVAHLDEHGEITPAQWKEITGTSRKFSIPLAEYFDKEKVTLRVGEVRKRRG